jgi:hypothetical protein
MAALIGPASDRRLAVVTRIQRSPPLAEASQRISHVVLSRHQVPQAGPLAVAVNGESARDSTCVLKTTARLLLAAIDSVVHSVRLNE